MMMTCSLKTSGIAQKASKFSISRSTRKNVVVVRAAGKNEVRCA